MVYFNKSAGVGRSLTDVITGYFDQFPVKYLFLV